MKNKVQLITYVSRLGEGKLENILTLLDGPLESLFGGIHLLPFFYPVDGEDAGFDPIDHATVDPKLGDWAQVRRLSQKIDLMADLIVNHISSDSRQFRDVWENGDQSVYKELFLTFDKVFPEGAQESDLATIYRPRPGLPFTSISLKDGSKRIFWTTFTPKQIDIDVKSQAGSEYLTQILRSFRHNGISMIRLDAVGYAVKSAGTNCFMTPETFDFISKLTDQARQMGLEVLVEIHSYYQQQIQIARKVDRVYDFALPPLILHTLFKRNAHNLKKWLKIAPRNVINVLDTHDGIGIVDIGPGPLPDQEGLVSNEDLDSLVEQIHHNSKGQSRRATGAAASNLDLYQVNCTFYDALGRDDQAYLLARIIQFFSPGIPQVYYVGLFAGENDMQLLKETGVGRDINRQYFSRSQIEEAINKAVVSQLFDLIRFRNGHPAFEGVFILKDSPDDQLILRWEYEKHWAELALNLADLSFRMEFSQRGRQVIIHSLQQLKPYLSAMVLS